jgi:uncharacterized protein YndB with AHSA1/START domain
MSATATTLTPTPISYELKITRTFDAPRDLVWKAWTNPEMMLHWMAPRGFAISEATMPLEKGARWTRRIDGLQPATQQTVHLSQSGTVLEARPPEFLKFTFAWDDRSSVGLGPSPYKENTVTVRFEEKGTQTVMHFTQGPFAAEGECKGHTGGWNSSFDKFAELLATLQLGRTQDPHAIPTELHLKRIFKAPRELVFAAWTNPSHLAAWWGPRGFTIPRCEFEAHAGGNIHIDMRAPDGTIYPMAGEVLDFYPPYRFHFTASALDARGNTMFTNWNSVFFEEVEGGTRVTLDVHVMNQTDVAPQYLKGMREGWAQTLDKFAEYIEHNQRNAHQ